MSNWVDKIANFWSVLVCCDPALRIGHDPQLFSTFFTTFFSGSIMVVIQPNPGKKLRWEIFGLHILVSSKQFKSLVNAKYRILLITTSLQKLRCRDSLRSKTYHCSLFLRPYLFSVHIFSLKETACIILFSTLFRSLRCICC